MSNKIPGIYIHSDNPNLGRIFDMVDSGTLCYDDGRFNIPSQLHGLDFETIGILLSGGLIRVFIIEWVDEETHQYSQYTNKEDIEILRSYVYEEGIHFAESCGRICTLITRCVITHDSIDKDIVKTFWKNYYEHNLK